MYYVKVETIFSHMVGQIDKIIQQFAIWKLFTKIRYLWNSCRPCQINLRRIGWAKVFFDTQICAQLKISKQFKIVFTFLSFKFKVERPRHTAYYGKLSYFNLKSLNKRRNYLLYTILSKLLNNSFDCPYLLSQLNFWIIIKSTRNNDLFNK